MKISKVMFMSDNGWVDLTDLVNDVELPIKRPEVLHHKPKRRLVFEVSFRFDDADKLIRLLLYPMQSAWHSVN